MAGEEIVHSPMTQQRVGTLIRFSLATGLARLLLRSAIITIRLMQWLYNRGLIRRHSTDKFFELARRLERRALHIAARRDRIA